MPLKSLRLLLLEHSPRDAEQILVCLAGDGFDCTLRRAQSQEEFATALAEDGPELILATFSLPGFDGLSALRMAQQLCPDVPFLFVAEAAGEEQVVEALRHGAADFVCKDRLERLGPAVQRALAAARERAARLRAEEAQRQRAEQLAEDVRRKDEFMTRLSYELRNPLAPIVNALYLLRVGDPPDPTLREAREVIERQVGRLTHLVDDLADVFTVTQHKLVLRRERLDLARLAWLAAEDQRLLLREAGIELVVEAPGPLWVVGDAARLAQAVSNLVQNAAAFTPRGGRVTVAVRGASASERASVVVRDTGSGIAAELLPHVFDPFARAEVGPPHSRGGLGLMLVKGVVELHGGQVHASSPGPGQGSEFGFWLPLVQEERAGAQTAALPEARRLRILVVEDHKDAARTLRILLVRSGHEVALAYTGKEGVTAARDWRPNVVLCDLGLPEMDGFEVARTLRRQPETAGCRLIAISGYGQDDDRRRCKEVGFDLHLTKPVDPAELQRVLASLPV
jgi:signal transduction histidine kinase